MVETINTNRIGTGFAGLISRLVTDEEEKTELKDGTIVPSPTQKCKENRLLKMQISKKCGTILKGIAYAYLECQRRKRKQKNHLY